jgi:predicted alpha/beta superfamily hydrolase
MTCFKKLSMFSLALCICTTLCAQVTDSVFIQTAVKKTFHSAILKEKRKIIIQTPSRMGKHDRYPVLYVLDGEAQGIMTGGQVQYLSESYKVIPNLIVVSIENTDRTRDLTPTHSIIGPDGKPDTTANAFGRNSGGGEKFLDFIHKELMPYIEANYPTAPYRILSGHSLGGLMAVYCLLHHPEYFNAYIAISPSLQWDGNVMLTMFNQKTSFDVFRNKILYFSDASEGKSFHDNQLALDSILRSKNYAGLKFKRFYYPEESHVSEPVKAFYDALRFIYPDWHLPYSNSAFRKTVSSRMIIDKYDQLSAAYGYRVLPPHDDMNQIARFLRNDPARINDAIELLELNSKNYPASTVVADLLGDVYAKSGDPVKAEASYRKALAPDPSDQKIIDKIRQLKSIK